MLLIDIILAACFLSQPGHAGRQARGHITLMRQSLLSRNFTFIAGAEERRYATMHCRFLATRAGSRSMSICFQIRRAFRDTQGLHFRYHYWLPGFTAIGRGCSGEPLGFREWMMQRGHSLASQHTSQALASRRAQFARHQDKH